MGEAIQIDLTFLSVIADADTEISGNMLKFLINYNFIVVPKSCPLILHIFVLWPCLNLYPSI